MAHYARPVDWPAEYEPLLRKATAGGMTQCGLAIQGNLGTNQQEKGPSPANPVWMLSVNRVNRPLAGAPQATPTGPPLYSEH